MGTSSEPERWNQRSGPRSGPERVPHRWWVLRGFDNMLSERDPVRWEEVEETSFELPNTFMYTNNGDGTVDLLLSFPVDALTAEIPPELAPVVGSLLVNDLPVVLTLMGK